MTNSDFRRIIVFCSKIAVMDPLTPAQRAKYYREKNKAKVHEREALRKKLLQIEMKVSNLERNKARLLKEKFTTRSREKE